MDLKELANRFANICDDSDGQFRQLARQSQFLTEAVADALFELKSEIEGLKETVTTQAAEIGELKRSIQNLMTGS